MSFSQLNIKLYVRENVLAISQNYVEFYLNFAYINYVLMCIHQLSTWEPKEVSYDERTYDTTLVIFWS